MSKFIVYNQDGQIEGEYALDKERITIGRKPYNDIQLKHVAVSGEHALVITIRNDSFLEDLDSTNGTRVNNQPVKKCVLQEKDEIRIGGFLLKYIYEPLVNPLQDDDDLGWLMDFDETIDADSGETEGKEQAGYVLGDTLKRSSPLLRTEKTSVPGKKNYIEQLSVYSAGLQILSGPGAGHELQLEKTLTTIGKPGLQMAVITRRTGGYFLTHIEGGEFPLLNGVSIGLQSRALKNHDIIELAGTKMEFYLK